MDMSGRPHTLGALALPTSQVAAGPGWCIAGSLEEDSATGE